MRLLREFLKRVLPDRLVSWIRRRRAARRYLRALSYEVLERETRLDDLEARVLARRDGFYQRLVREVLERTDLVLQELDRRIEGQGARHAERLRELEEEMARLRGAIEELRAALGQSAPAGTEPEAVQSEPERQAARPE